MGGCIPSQSILWWASPCWFDPLTHPQTVSQSDLSFCILFQNFENIPNFETSFKTFPFLLEKQAASHSLDLSEPPQEKHPTLRVTLDCGYESGQGVWGAVLPWKEPILLPLRDSAKTSSPPNPPLCWQSKNTGEAAPAHCRSNTKVGSHLPL